MTVAAKSAVAGVADNAPRRATAITVTVMSLLLATKVGWATGGGGAGRVMWVAALFGLPLLYAFPGPRRLIAQYRWSALAVQAGLTWVPFAIYGGRWVAGIGGLLAGLVLLLVPGRVSWLVAGLLLGADVAVRATVTGLPWTPVWSGALWAVLVFADDALTFFGMVRLAQIVGEVQEARRQAADLAVVRERLRAGEEVRSAVGGRLAAVAAYGMAAQQALPCDAAHARTQIAAAGVTARDAVAKARAVAAHGRGPGLERAAPPASGVVIGARLAWAVLIVGLFAYAAEAVNVVFLNHDGLRIGVLVAVGYVVTVALQLRHSRPAHQARRPMAWAMTLTLQAALAYVYFLPSLAAFMSLAPFLVGSVLLLVPGRWRWAGYAAVVVSWPALFSTVPLHGITAAERGARYTLSEGISLASVGLLVYGLSRLAGLARELEQLRAELAREAAVQERLRVARDVHDLLGLGLSAVALKADLAGALIGRDDARAAAEITQMTQICAAAQTDIRLVTGQGTQLCLAAELAAARQILASAGIQVHANAPIGPLPAVADEVLAPVLREAVTNILRHATATACTIEVAADGGSLRLHVSNDGATDQPAARHQDAGDGESHGLANLSARVHAVGGQLSAQRSGTRFILTTEITLPAPS